MVARRLLDAVLAQLPSAVAVVEAPSGRTIVANTRSIDIFRQQSPTSRDGVESYAEYVGFLPDGSRMKATDWPLARSLLTGEVVRGEEIEILRGDGTRGFIRTHSAPIRDDAGKIMAAVVIFDDVTDRHVAYSTAKQREEELALLTDALPLLVSFIDNSLHYRLINRAYEDWFGMPRDQIVGRSLIDVAGEEATALVRPHIERALAGESVAFEATLPYPELGARDVRVRYIPRREGDGSIGGFVGIVEDISAHKKAEDSVRLIADASRLLASSLDVRVTLKSLADLCVPRLGDWCGIDLLDDNGSPEPLAVAHRDPAKVELVRTMRQRYPLEPGSSSGLSGVLRFGKSELYADLTDGALEATAVDAEHLAMLRAIGMRSVILVPLRARGRILGAMSLSSAESGRRFGEDDLALVEEIAARASLAIDNARLFESERASRLALESANLRLRILSDASRAFAAHSRDIETLLDVIATTLTEAFGDFASINIVSEDGLRLEQPAFAARSPEIVDLLKQHAIANPMRVGVGLIGGVVASGQPLLVPVIDRAALIARVDPAYRTFFDKTTPTTLMAVPFRARGDRVAGCISVARVVGAPFDEADLGLLGELADRAALALENADLYARSQKAVRLRDEFLSVASHELKTPLTTMILQIHSVLRRPDATTDVVVSVAQLNKIDRQLERMNQLISRLLDVSVIAAGKLRLEPEDADLGALAHEVAARFAEQASHAHSSLTVDVRGDTKGRFDAGRLDQVLTNLLANAIKFGHGSAIGVLVEGEADIVKVHVSDGGPGIAPADQERIFERFERASTTKSHGGMGLGLWITRQIVEAHGGTVAVRSEPERGAVFVVALPRRGA